MDHEISSSQLGDGLEGWDWTCMQLNDGTEVKAYRLKMDGEAILGLAVYWIDRQWKRRKVFIQLIFHGKKKIYGKVRKLV